MKFREFLTLLLAVLHLSSSIHSFAFCASDGPVRIHPIGDSTTEGYELESAWRYWLDKAMAEAGYDGYDFVGSRRGTFQTVPVSSR